jgi:hypothetical protein
VASEGSWDAGTAGCGAVLDGVDWVYRAAEWAGPADGPRRAFAAVRPPGHHALRDSAMGFCLFGNVAVAALYARARHGARRVLVVDWDVHHGNGTQALVEHEPDVRFVSMHQWPWYPGTGAAEDRGPHASVWNVPMPAGPPGATLRRRPGARRRRGHARVGARPRAPLRRLRLARRRPARRVHAGARRRRPADARDDRARRRVVRRPPGERARGGYAPERLGEAAVAHLRALG